MYTVLPTTERVFNLILKFQDMFVAEVVQQIVLPSCSYDFSYTTFTIIAWLTSFFLSQKTSKQQTWILFSVQILCHVELWNFCFGTFSVLIFTTQLCPPTAVYVAFECPRKAPIKFALSTSDFSELHGHSNAAQQKSLQFNDVQTLCTHQYYSMWKIHIITKLNASIGY